MKSFLGCILLLTPLVATAAAPTTLPLRPQPPAEPREMAATVDMRQPTFVPKFAKADTTPAGHFAERDSAYRFSASTPIYYGYGFYPGGYYGFGSGSWGTTQTFWR